MKRLTRYALFSCTDKTNCEKMAQFFYDKGFSILSTGGTYNHLRSNLRVGSNSNSNNTLTSIESFINYPEICEGRVKTLHPKIHAAILSKRDNYEEMIKHDIPLIDIVVCNLYSFENDKSIENIDIGGVTLLRGAAKNYKHVTVISNPDKYDYVINNWSNFKESDRLSLAIETYKTTSRYDKQITGWMKGLRKHSHSRYQTHTRNYSTVTRDYKKQLDLKYGTNPYQRDSAIFAINNDKVPFVCLNGGVSYINILGNRITTNLIITIIKC